MLDKNLQNTSKSTHKNIHWKFDYLLVETNKIYEYTISWSHTRARHLWKWLAPFR